MTDDCPCGHGAHRVPGTEREALALAGHYTAIDHLLVVVARDADRWLGVLRCTRCGRHWAEDALSSGHADLFFVYPIGTVEPRAWLDRARPLRISRS